LGRLRSSGLARLLAVGLAAASLVLLGAVPALGATATPAAGSTGPAQSGGHTPRTVVSLTFDDGDADQMAAAQVLHRYRLPATFYIITGAVGTPGYVTLPDLRQLAADGNEIGGHTVSHLRLTALTTAEARRQVCESRSILARWGYRAISFAYPGGASSPRIESPVLRCPSPAARAGTRSSLPSASRCLWVSGPRLSTTRATHSRSSSES
jgi:peptidoglycan/xylan/chitin deacetylase (PgdA/CDA1 family)